MKNLNDKNTRQELVRRYLNAETTLEEERLLADFLTDTDAALSQEEEDVRLLLQMSDCMERSAIKKMFGFYFKCPIAWNDLPFLKKRLTNSTA